MKEQKFHYNHNSDFIHHHSPAYLYGREIVFGMQDGMVSVIGALTGIAVGTNDHFVVLLSGTAIIAIGAISMAIGTFTSLGTERKMQQRMLFEEQTEISRSPKEERKEIETYFLKGGWPKDMAEKMAECASGDDTLMLNEMAYRELSIVPEKKSHPIKNSIAMFFAWFAGGSIPLLPYFFFPVGTGIYVSAGITLFGLFLLGVITSRYTKQNPFMAGLTIFLLAGMAIIAGYSIGRFADMFIPH
ncbi:MAG: VIT1/CCC1 transporter family protein [Candidatus Paceibacterota bacterium]|jgi:VIT1/CCC1 family predicted Fe2+/Mn2+ transporter